MEVDRRCLLIGNTRWHWAENAGGSWEFSHTLPDPARIKFAKIHLDAWASVGDLPSELSLDPVHRLSLQDVPIRQAPTWLGIDRALAAWGALQRAKEHGLDKAGILVADAGTVLSLTRVTAEARFNGGQLAAGLRMQLSSMAQGAKQLDDPGFEGELTNEFFPQETSEAMRRGSLQALVGILFQAQREAKLPIWLCGGDAPLLLDHLKERNIDFAHHPHLVLEGMVDVQSRVSSGLSR